MSITREGRFLIWRTAGSTPCIGLESDILASCIEECRSHPYKGVFGAPQFGFREIDLESLRQLPDLEKIWFWDVTLQNIDALYALPALQFFGVHPDRPAIDFSRLPTLKSLVWVHKAKDKGIDALQSLDSLHVWHFKPKSKSFSDLQLSPHITELQINWANPSTLAGLTPIPSLRRLEISRCRNLESLALLPELYPSLEYLVVSTCGRIADGEGERAVERLPLLTHAFVQGKLLV